ncbi:MAG: DUF4157 domain-containing protein [Myxococcales bacterium]|nr:DUF4157 domain-containing protein [Myxococcales bacterium]
MPFDDRLRPEPDHTDAQTDAHEAADEAERAAAVGQSAEVLGVAADDAAGVDVDALHAVARTGLSSEAQALPHRETVQAAFGQHDVGELRAHLDPRAAAAAEVLGAEAFSTGEDVAFAEQPDLAGAATEAARALWQQAGPEVREGLAQAGDEAAIIDAIGERVAEGREVEVLLDRLLASPEGRGQGFEGDVAALAAWIEGDAGRDAADQDADLAPLEGADAQAAPWAERWLQPGSALDPAFEVPTPRGPGVRRRRRTGEGWLYTPGEAGAAAPAAEAPVAAESERK